MGAGKRRGRERQRAAPPPGCFTLTVGAFWVSVDVRTGEGWSKNGHTVPVGQRNGITAAVLGVMRKYGVEPEDPLQVRELMFGDG